MKNRKVFAGDHVPNIQPALEPIHPGQLIAGGNGIGTQNFPTRWKFIALNTGRPVLGVRGPRGTPNTTGAEPGARGAQFMGSDKHDPPPKPHPSPCTIVSIDELILSTFSLDIPDKSIPTENPFGVNFIYLSPFGSYLSGYHSFTSITFACVPASAKCEKDRFVRIFHPRPFVVLSSNIGFEIASIEIEQV